MHNVTEVIQAVTINNISISYANFPADVLAVASDYLQGYSSEYYFFQADEDSYILLLFDDFEYVSTGVLQVSESTVIQIDRIVTVHTDSISASSSGYFSGSFGGNAAGYTQGSTTGTISIPVSSEEVTFQYLVSSSGALTIRNPNFALTYASFDTMPRLIEGVENYAFTGVLLCVGVLAFKLFDRIFRRVY